MSITIDLDTTKIILYPEHNRAVFIFAHIFFNEPITMTLLQAAELMRQVAREKRVNKSAL